MNLNWWYTLSRAERGFFLFGLAMHILAFFYCTGYQHGDEHFQILEFAGYKLNLCTESSLAWEYEAQMRPGLQPFIAFVLGKISLGIWGEVKPFWISDMLRLLSLILGFASALALRRLAEAFFHHKIQLTAVSFLINFLWFFPFLHARFSSENWSGIFLIFALYFTFKDRVKFSKLNAKALVLSGICWALSFEFRFQLGTAALGFFLWLIFSREFNLRSFIYLLLGAICIVAISAVIDHWLYTNWVFPPWEYFKQITMVKESMFGESPWYDYVPQSLTWLGYPLGLLILCVFGCSIYRNYRNPLVWIFIVFTIFHMIIAHKEMRFLFPVFYLFPILLVAGVPHKWLEKQTEYYASSLQNAVLVLFVSALSIKTFVTSICYASPDVNTFRYLSKVASHYDSITVYCPYDIGYVMAHYYEFRFFRDKKIKMRFYHNDEQLANQPFNQKNTVVLTWGGWATVPRNAGLPLIYQSIKPYQKSLLFRGATWNRDEYAIYGKL